MNTDITRKVSMKVLKNDSNAVDCLQNLNNFIYMPTTQIRIFRNAQEIWIKWDKILYKIKIGRP